VTQAALPFDVCAGRHGGNRESVAANPARFSKRDTHATIMLLLSTAPMTSKRIAWELDRPLNAISGRLTELLSMGLIERTGERRDVCAVLRFRT